MRELVRGLAIGAALLIVVGAVINASGTVTLTLPDLGTAPWLLSRASGITAFIALGLDVALGLLLSTRLGDRVLARAHALELHRWLSPLTLALIAGHALLLLADTYVRFELLDAVVPFVAPYRPLAVGLGVLATYLAIVVHLSFDLRKRIGTAAWRRLHYLSFVAFVGAAVHAVLAGTDATRAWGIVALGLPSLLILGLIGYRLASALAARPAPARGSRDAGA